MAASDITIAAWNTRLGNGMHRAIGAVICAILAEAAGAILAAEIMTVV